MELHINQPRRVVGALEESAQLQKVKGLVLQHGAQRHPARQVRAELHPFKKLPWLTFEVATLDHAQHFQVGLILGFPDFGGQRAAHGTRVFSGVLQAGDDARRVLLVAHHEIHHVGRVDAVAGVLGFVSGLELADAEQALPAGLRHGLGLRQQRGLVIDVQHAGRVFGALGVAGHPEEMVGGAREHVCLSLLKSRARLRGSKCPWCRRLARS